MINVLSIDWDYYINTSNDVREECFPKIQGDIITEEERFEMWKPYYQKYDISTIGVLDEKLKYTEELIKRIEKNSPHIHILINDSHRFVYDIIEKEIKNHQEEKIKLYNIDHHHDMYQYRTSSEKVNCANWAEVLKEEFGDKFDYNWIKREDSDEYSLAGKVECRECSIKDIEEKDFDIIYLCRSGAWSPPHLDSKYAELKDCILEGIKVDYEKKYII